MYVLRKLSKREHKYSTLASFYHYVVSKKCVPKQQSSNLITCQHIFVADT
jgi:hypothetical protein